MISRDWFKKCDVGTENISNDYAILRKPITFNMLSLNVDITDRQSVKICLHIAEKCCYLM
jgi:hypothetical protein